MKDVKMIIFCKAGIEIHLIGLLILLYNKVFLRKLSNNITIILQIFTKRYRTNVLNSKILNKNLTKALREIILTSSASFLGAECTKNDLIKQVKYYIINNMAEPRLLY